MATPEQLLQKWQGKIVPQSFNGGFVTLSYVVSLIGAASTLELINRRTAIKGIFNQYAPHHPSTITRAAVLTK
jgi:hypothetical protein